MAVLTMKRWQRKFNRWSRKIPSAVETALKAGGEIVRAEVVKNHLSGPKMARGIGHMSKGTLQPRTGKLRSTINSRIKKKGQDKSVTIGSNLVYARIHEKGGRTGRGHRVRMPKRPYLAPSLRKKQKVAVTLILDKIMEAYKKSG